MLMRQVRTDGSYLSASDPRILFGLGETQPLELRIRWPDGTTVTLPPPTPGVYTTIRQSDS